MDDGRVTPAVVGLGRKLAGTARAPLSSSATANNEAPAQLLVPRSGPSAAGRDVVGTMIRPNGHGRRRWVRRPRRSGDWLMILGPHVPVGRVEDRATNEPSSSAVSTAAPCRSSARTSTGFMARSTTRLCSEAQTMPLSKDLLVTIVAATVCGSASAEIQVGALPVDAISRACPSCRRARTIFAPPIARYGTTRPGGAWKASVVSRPLRPEIHWTRRAGAPCASSTVAMELAGPVRRCVRVLRWAVTGSGHCAP